MPTVFRWLAKHEDFQRIYSVARGAQADYLAEEMLDICDDASNDWMKRAREDGTVETVFNAEHVQRSRLRIDTRKWLLAKLAPKKYSDRLISQHEGSQDGPEVKFQLIIKNA